MPDVTSEVLARLRLVRPAEHAAEVAERALDILERDKKSRRRMYETLGIPLDDTVL